jgi:Ulp1 family protease
LANSIGIVGQLKRILVKVPNQINCNDCGVTTCLFMLCMAYNVENELTYDDSRFVSRHFRQRLFADIVKKTVTPLQKQNR